MTIQSKFADLSMAHNCSTRCDLRDRSRFEHPSGQRWASLRFPEIGKPDYRVFVHSAFDNPHHCAISRGFNDLASALDYLHSFLFINPAR